MKREVQTAPPCRACQRCAFDGVSMWPPIPLDASARLVIRDDAIARHRYSERHGRNDARVVLAAI